MIQGQLLAQRILEFSIDPTHCLSQIDILHTPSVQNTLNILLLILWPPGVMYAVDLFDLFSEVAEVVVGHPLGMRPVEFIERHLLWRELEPAVYLRKLHAPLGDLYGPGAKCPPHPGEIVLAAADRLKSCIDVRHEGLIHMRLGDGVLVTILTEVGS